MGDLFLNFPLNHTLLFSVIRRNIQYSEVELKASDNSMTLSPQTPLIFISLAKIYMVRIIMLQRQVLDMPGAAQAVS
jgi:hypothetical protein